ncbi:hypothetical protein LPJ75_003672, partial [Coemansia sp. RSA 2598]
MGSIPPNQTIYLRNLNDKIQKDVLKRALYSLCISYGRILDIVALKTMKMRGQAFVVFDDITSATAAMRQLNGKHIFGRPISAEYALSKSEVVAKEDGSYRFGEQRKHMSARERKKLLGVGATTGSKRRQSDSDVDMHGGSKRMATDHESDTHTDKEASSDSDDGDGNDDDEGEKMAIEGDSDNDSDGSDSSDDIGPLPPKPQDEAEGAVAEQVQPSPTLFVTNLPKNVSAKTLTGLFQQYSGFREVRQVPGKKDIAFVDYNTIEAAAAARD